VAAKEAAAAQEACMRIDLFAPMPPPAKIQRSGSHFFHMAEAYPVEAAYHTPKLRNAFLRKVYGILCVQLLLGAGIATLLMYTLSIRFFVMTQAAWLVYPIMVLSLVTIVALRCSKDSYPCNCVCLLLFTIMMSVLVGFVCSVYAPQQTGDVVLQSILLLAMLFFALTLYACQSNVNSEFSILGAFSMFFLMTVFGVFFLSFNPPPQTAMKGLVGSVLFGGFILYDTHRVCKVYGYDDYIVATIELHLDFVNLFLYLLRLLASSCGCARHAGPCAFTPQ